MTKDPPWLKAMQNGHLGESRVRAFLAERFWILERSVDVQGADFLVQRRDLSASILADRAPRMAIIQAKFVQDGTTEIVIPWHYVRQPDGRIPDEFFLLVTTGAEDDGRMFMLTGSDIVDTFSAKERRGAPVYATAATRILSNNNLEITTTRRLALNRIEAALARSSFRANRHFVYGFGIEKPTRDQVHPDFLVPLQNWYGDIPDLVLERREAARHLLGQLAEAADVLENIANAADPIDLARIVADELEPLVSYGGKLAFDATNLYSDELAQVAQAQREHLTRIRSAGIQGNYFALIEKLDGEARCFARQMREKPVPPSVDVVVTFKPKVLGSPSVRIESASIRLTDDKALSETVDVADDRVHMRFPGWVVLNYGKWHDAVTDSYRIVRPFQQVLDQDVLAWPESDY